MSRDQVLTEDQWKIIEPMLPSSKGKQSRPYRDHRQVLNGIMFRYRCAWRDLPEQFGPWQTVWKRHAKFSRDGTWDAILAQLLAQADAAGQLDWQVSIDSTVARVHQHGANTRREVAVIRPSAPQRVRRHGLGLGCFVCEKHVLKYPRGGWCRGPVRRA